MKGKEPVKTDVDNYSITIRDQKDFEDLLGFFQGEENDACGR